MAENASEGVRGGEKATWMTMIRGAARGNLDDRAAFAQRYLPVVRAYIGSRWRSSPWIAHLEDAVQDVFIACFQHSGALDRFEQGRDGGFRAFLFGVVRNVTQRIEGQQAKQHEREGAAGSAVMREQPSDDATHSVVFDRAWAISLLEQAREKMEQRALPLGDAATRRLELLRLLFEENLPVREIAAAWDLPAEVVHQEYRRARREFRNCLRQVVAYHSLDSTEDLDAECTRILGVIQGAN